METIRKKICIDDFISHRNGISPYISKDSDNIDIKYVDSISSKSNYGSFPCDFALIEVTNEIDDDFGVLVRKNTELSRLRYLDVLKWYNNVNDAVRNGVFLKRIRYNYDFVTHEECVNVNEPLSNCGKVTSSITDTELIETSLWVIDESDDHTMFECRTVDSLFFKTYKNGIYEYDIKNTEKYKLIKENSVAPQDELPKEDKDFINKMDEFVIGTGNVDDISSYNGVIFSIDENVVIYAIEGYDEYVKYETLWDEWWNQRISACTSVEYENWEEFVFDSNYNEPLGLRFIYDFDTYVLGKIKVPEKYYEERIEGSKVPNTVFYLNYMDYFTWFNNNAEYVNANEDIRIEWEKRGGENFINFLSGISPVFITDTEIGDENPFIYFGYVSPNIEFDFSFIDEFNNEYSYDVYEYSIDFNGNFIDATIEYESGKTGNIESALTPSFVQITDSAITVESKLNTLFSNDVYYINKDIYGIFENFNNGGKLFKCTNHTGSSITDEQIKCTSGCVEFYSKSGDTWNFVKKIDVPETEICVTIQEEYPLTVENAYQVVGIEKLYENSPEYNVISTKENINYNLENTIKTVSSITTYYKTINRTYSWWECVFETDSEIICGDGETIDFGDPTNKRYRNILLLSCVPDCCEDKNGQYYYMVKYDNGYTGLGSGVKINKKYGKKLLKLPFSFGKKNIESCSGNFENIVKYDKITDIVVDGDKLTVKYVIGATEGKDINKSGIHYEEVYDYYVNEYDDVIVDGFYKAKILYEKIVPHKEFAYSEDFGASRNFIPATITGMEVGTQWTRESALKAYLYTDNSFDNLIEYPNISVDITFNRGNASAWESHFKLSECNTFEDLQNYGNNFFNL